MPEHVPPRQHPPTRVTRANEVKRRTEADARLRKAVSAIAAAVSYGLVHSLEEAIERNRTRGWADDALQTFRLESDDEVRAAWAIRDQRSRDR
jgi:hypothetical protein